MTDYKRLKKNLYVLEKHNKTCIPVYHITDGQMHEIDLMKQIIGDCRELLSEIKVLERALQLACEPRDDWGAYTYDYYEEFINQAKAEIEQENNND